MRTLEPDGEGWGGWEQFYRLYKYITISCGRICSYKPDIIVATERGATRCSAVTDGLRTTPGVTDQGVVHYGSCTSRVSSLLHSAALN